MDGILKKYISRIGDVRGDSIAEVLVALLISSLSLVMLATMISSASKMILTSKDKMNNYELTLNELIPPGLNDAVVNIVAVQSMGNNGAGTPVVNGVDQQIEIKYAVVNSSINNEQIVSYYKA